MNTNNKETSMTFPVQIEFGNHAITAHLHAVPHVGERIICAFPASGIPKMFLIVTSVTHLQSSEIHGKETKDPFRISVVTDDAPEPQWRELNRAAMKKAISGE